MPRKGARSQFHVVLVPLFTAVCASRGVRTNARKGGLRLDSVSIGNGFFLVVLRIEGDLKCEHFISRIQCCAVSSGFCL